MTILLLGLLAILLGYFIYFKIEDKKGGQGAEA